MEKVEVNKIFEKLIEDKYFRDDYLLAYMDRFVYTATDLEKQLDYERRKNAIECLINAFIELNKYDGSMLSAYDLVKIGDIVNKDEGISGFRRINVSAGRYAKWVPVYSQKIIYELYNLLNNYYKVWIDRDVYEKEAAFHIYFMRIHPFEDGNKRTAKIILNYNLIKQNYPPVIISESETQIYYEFINNEDVIGFANYLREKSMNELNTMMSYYKVSNNIPITESVVDYIFSDKFKAKNKKRM